MSDSLWSFREADRQQAPHLNRPSAIVANPTQATDIHRSLSTFGGEASGSTPRNPHPGRPQSAFPPLNLFGRDGRQTSVDQTRAITRSPAKLNTNDNRV